MGYPRRRAPIACTFCRQRKRRCSGEKPTCSLCRASGVSCKYLEGTPEETQIPGSSTVDLLRRLEQLETIVKEQSSATQPALDQNQPEIPPSTPSLSSGQVGFLDDIQPQDGHEVYNSPNLTAFMSSFAPEFDGFPVREQFLLPIPPVGELLEYHTPQSSSITDNDAPTIIPQGHHTITASLFLLEPIKALVGEYPLDFFFQIESDRGLCLASHTEAQVSLIMERAKGDKQRAEKLISGYFSKVQPLFPILDPEEFMRFFDTNMHNSTGRDEDVAVCLVVLALGELTEGDDIGKPSYEEEMPGMEYFSLAHSLLTKKWIVDMKPNFSLITGLIIGAIYLLYLAKPLEAWNLVHMASSRLQLLVTQSSIRSRSRDETDLMGRLCWTCFVLECDSLAEFHLPRSGIEFTIDRMQFPRLGMRSNRDGILFLALCSIRRLLNRIHNAAYTSSTKALLEVTTPSSSAEKNTFSVATAFNMIKSLESVLVELGRQVDSWYSSLPDMIRPDLSTNVPLNAEDAWLRLRYWSAKHIIGRPCLFYVASSEPQDIPSYALDLAEMCIDSCRNYIETAEMALKNRTYYNWMIVQGLMAYAFTLTISSKAPLVQHRVLDLDTLIQKSISALQRWSSPDSTADSVTLILKTLRRKQQLK